MMKTFEPSFPGEQRETAAFIAPLVDEARIPSSLERERLKNKLGDMLQGSPADKQAQIAKYILELTEQRYCDPRPVFTGEKVPNKEFAKQSIRELIAQGNGNFCRIALDLEGLKTINDLAGHEQGDKYLHLVYTLLKETVAEIKREYPETAGLDFVISSEGGDEFGVLMVGEPAGDFDIASARLHPFLPERTGVSPAHLPLHELFITRFNERLDAADLSGIVPNAALERHFPGIASSDYRFFASASAGALAFGDPWADEEAVKSKMEEYRTRRGTIGGVKENEDAALFELYLDRVETALNRSKEDFKDLMRKTDRNGPGGQLRQHIEVLARNAEYRALLDENLKLKEAIGQDGQGTGAV